MSTNKQNQPQTLEELQLENGKLKEDIEERDKTIKELTKSVNSALSNDKKANNKSVTDSLEYKALQTENITLAERNQELEQLIRNDMKQNPEKTFQNAADIPPQEIEFPATQLSTFFMDCRNAKKVMYIQIVDNKVKTWQSDYMREKRAKEIKPKAKPTTE